MAPAALSAASKSGPERLKRRRSPCSSPTTSADRSSEKTTVSPSPSLRSGLASADHVPSACGSISVTSIFAVTSPCALILVRVPLSRAGITRVSFRISRSPGRRMPGRSKTWASRV
jgi:hypothetical protein